VISIGEWEGRIDGERGRRSVGKRWVLKGGRKKQKKPKEGGQGKFIILYMVTK